MQVWLVGWLAEPGGLQVGFFLCWQIAFEISFCLSGAHLCMKDLLDGRKAVQQIREQKRRKSDQKICERNS